MSDTQPDPNHQHRDDAPAGRSGWAAAAFRGFRYANVTATLALFVALGGTASAVVALDRDSVGSVQIRTDAVRAPEIRTDAVRSPEIQADAVRAPEIQADAVRSAEIQADAVRSPEIRDGGVSLADLAPGARTALDAPRVRVAEDAGIDVPTCSSATLTDCSNLLSLALHSGSWLVQAKFTVRNNGNPHLFTACALVQDDTTVLDSMSADRLDVRGTAGSTETAVLTAAVTDVTDDTIALRCIEEDATHVAVDRVVMTALEIGSVARP